MKSYSGQEGERGQVSFNWIALFAFIGLLTSVLALIRQESLAGADPVLVFLLVAYPFLIGMTVYFYLKDKKASNDLQEEYYVKWHLQGLTKLCIVENDLQIVREEVVDSLLRLVRPSVVCIYESKPNSERLEITHQGGMKNLPEAASQGYTFGEGVPGWVMQNQKPAVFNDLAKDQFLQVDRWAQSMGLRSYGAVPVIVREQAAGVIAMYSLEASFFDDSKILLAQIVAQVYGLSLGQLEQ